MTHPLSSPWLWLALPALVPLAMTVLNLLTWRRGRPGQPPERLVSVLIPARNEARSIEDAVRSVLDGESRVHELIVCDDGSTDATPEILSRLAAEDARVKVLRGAPLPPGWVGKPHACHQLAAAALGDVLIFVDADVTLSPDAVARIAQLFDEAPRADLITAVPRQRMGTLAEALLMPLLHLSYTAWLPLRLIELVSDPRVLAANGQILAVERDTYFSSGGFAAIRSELVDDMALCRLVKERGGTVRFVDGHHLASCRMYRSGAEVWAGFSKNLYEGIGGSPLALAFVLGLHLGLWVLPWAGLVAGATQGDPTLSAAGAFGALAGVVTRLLLAWRYDHPVWSAFLHPVAVLGLVGIGLRSWAWSRRDAIEWAGRRYAARTRRLGRSAR